MNLATHLLLDGFRKEYQAAVLVANDSDLLEPVRIVSKELGLVVGMVHAEEGNVVSRGALQGGDRLHVRLGATPPVQELVDVQDPHRDAS